MCINRRILLLIVCIVLSAAKPAKNSDIIDVDPNAVFPVQDDKKVVLCTYVSPSYLAGTMMGTNKFKLASSQITQLNLKIKKLKKKNQSIKAIKKKLSSTKKEVKRKNGLCSTEAAKQPSPTPVPSSDSVSMSKLEYTPGLSEVRNLTTRAGFGYSKREEWLLNIATSQGIDALVDNFTASRDEEAGLLARFEDLKDQKIGSNDTESAVGQRQAFFELWTHTNNPYAERVALFLLGVWTVSGDVIDDETFRSVFGDYYKKLQNAAYSDTNLSALALELTRDPLMLIYLNNELNVKGSPNENYARELMELFTVGTEDLDKNPNYTETQTDGSGDIAVAAKMLTGWRVDYDYQISQLVPEFIPYLHDTGPHTMFEGKSYAFTGTSDEDLVNGIFAKHPNVKNYYAQEILKEYLTPDPPRELVENFARIIQENNFKLRPSMTALLKSKAFYHPLYRHSLPKTSAEFAVEAIKILDMEDNYNYGEVERKLRDMGMAVNAAPSVFWFKPAGWTSAAVSLEKSNFAALILGDSTSQSKTSPAWVPENALPSGVKTNLEVINYVADKLGIPSLPAAVIQELNDYMNKERQYNNTFTNQPYDNTDPDLQRQKGLGLYYILMTSPYFQLK